MGPRRSSGTIIVLALLVGPGWAHQASAGGASELPPRPGPFDETTLEFEETGDYSIHGVYDGGPIGSAIDLTGSFRWSGTLSGGAVELPPVAGLNRTVVRAQGSGALTWKANHHAYIRGLVGNEDEGNRWSADGTCANSISDEPSGISLSLRLEQVPFTVQTPWGPQKVPTMLFGVGVTKPGSDIRLSLASGESWRGNCQDAYQGPVPGNYRFTFWPAPTSFLGEELRRSVPMEANLAADLNFTADRTAPWGSPDSVSWAGLWGFFLDEPDGYDPAIVTHEWADQATVTEGDMPWPCGLAAVTAFSLSPGTQCSANGRVRLAFSFLPIFCPKNAEWIKSAMSVLEASTRTAPGADAAALNQWYLDAASIIGAMIGGDKDRMVVGCPPGPAIHDPIVRALTRIRDAVVDAYRGNPSKELAGLFVRVSRSLATVDGADAMGRRTGDEQLLSEMAARFGSGGTGSGTRVAIQVHSPVSLEAYSLTGQHVGWNATTQTVDVQIPGASYEGRPMESQDLKLPDGFFTIVVRQLGEGTFTLDASLAPGRADQVFEETLESHVGNVTQFSIFSGVEDGVDTITTYPATNIVLYGPHEESEGGDSDPEGDDLPAASATGSGVPETASSGIDDGAGPSANEPHDSPAAEFATALAVIVLAVAAGRRRRQIRRR